MNSQKQVISLIKSMSGQANILTIPRIYIKILKSHRAALLLSQCVYWSDKTGDPDGWFYKTFAEWQDEIGLNQHAMNTAAEALTKIGLIEVKLRKVGATPKNHWRVDFEKLTEVITSHLAESSNSDLAETAKSDLAENYKPSITKTTTKSTISRKRETDPRSKSAQVTAFRAVTGKYPHNSLYDKIIAAIGERSENDLRPLFVEWCARGYNPNSINWLDWVTTGIPVRFVNGKQDAAQVWLQQKENQSGLTDVFSNF